MRKYTKSILFLLISLLSGIIIGILPFLIASLALYSLPNGEGKAYLSVFLLIIIIGAGIPCIFVFTAYLIINAAKFLNDNNFCNKNYLIQKYFVFVSNVLDKITFLKTNYSVKIFNNLFAGFLIIMLIAAILIAFIY